MLAKYTNSGDLQQPNDFEKVKTSAKRGSAQTIGTGAPPVETRIATSLIRFR
jgi:hypothetical protein